MVKTLFEKVWDAHALRRLPDGRTQLFVAAHLIHEVTSPQAFGMLRDLGLRVRYPERTFATVDHIVPTLDQKEPFADPMAQAMINELRKNCVEQGIRFFDIASGCQGIVHMVGPEQGITQPGSTLVCGDSHTATHGALGALAFGIGTSQVRDVLATQTLAMSKLKVRRINVNGALRTGVYAKDVILHIIRLLGINAGLGYAYEYGGSVFDQFSCEERMTVCNMSIEGGARCGYVNPDETTFAWMKGRPFAPKSGTAEWDTAVARWRSFASDPDAPYDDVVDIAAENIQPTVTWGIHPGQSLGINERLPLLDALRNGERETATEALRHMKLREGAPIKGTPVNTAFIGSCTNGRLTDLRETARLVKGHSVRSGVRALVVPGSQIVAAQCEREGIAQTFRDAGFEWRHAGCSMCLAMNADRLHGDELCASSSNRNFKGRQGSPIGRTVLMSPVMVAAAALTGQISDAREVFGLK
ncbi:MAG: 3-isopropylmalate dehydratase large subunit [Puniceicoccales bacterium]|jgi:3-isopropylmalate/(R)-2-methylmalate dehydratase large subunit|nr:3-isopropylmalate dehydratase large subunit [Puniceicoccales bacterium]